MDKYKYKALCRLFIISPLIWGGYYEWGSCLYSVALLVYLGVVFVKEGAVRIPKTLTLAAAAAVTVFMGLAFLWGVDKGMALIGMFKFLPLPLFAVAISQLKPEEKEGMLALVPPVGAVMVPVTAVMWLIPAVRDLFYVNSRLSGTFQYPNVFALYLLAGTVVILFKPKQNKKDMLCLASLLAGIILSGSRTVFVLLAATAVLFLIFTKQTRIRLIFAGMILAMLVLSVLYVIFTNNVSAIGRFLTISLSESNFVGRFLYFKDALPVILKHPLGLGYMGYYYLQGEFQTGVYYVVNVHNGFLQILLDVGWIPAAICIAAVLQGLRHGSWRERAIILLVCAHCMLDFDLQFISVCFLIILVMDLHCEKTFRVKSSPAVIGAVSLAGIAALYIGIAAGAYYLKSYDTAVKIYPCYTQAYVQMLTQAQTVPEMERLADEVEKYNKSVSIAYSAKARAAYAQGDFGEMIKQKQEALRLSKYFLSEYLDYFSMLAVGIQLYKKEGDSASAIYCRERILEIPKMMEDVLSQTSSIAWIIRDKPDLKLPVRFREALKMISELDL